MLLKTDVVESSGSVRELQCNELINGSWNLFAFGTTLSIWILDRKMPNRPFVILCDFRQIGVSGQKGKAIDDSNL